MVLVFSSYPGPVLGATMMVSCHQHALFLYCTGRLLCSCTVLNACFVQTLHLGFFHLEEENPELDRAVKFLIGIESKNGGMTDDSPTRWSD